TGASSGGSGFYDPGTGFPNHLAASISSTGITVNSISFTDPTHFTLSITVAYTAPLGGRTVTATNPDGQSITSVSQILTVACNPCPGDLDHDGDIDGDDFTLFLNAFGHSQGQPAFNAEADFDHDGVVTLADYQTW